LSIYLLTSLCGSLTRVSIGLLTRDIDILSVRPAVCLSVRQSHAGIGWKRLNILS